MPQTSLVVTPSKPNQQQYDKARRQAKRRRGECLQCRNKALRNKSICRHHYDALTTKRAERIANGLCPDCDRPATSNSLYCDFHQQYFSKHIKAYNRTRKGQYSKFRSVAKQRGIEVDLTYEEFRVLREFGVCSYCAGLLPRAAGGLDQSIPGTGYGPNRARPCCRACNSAKGRKVEEAYLEALPDVLFKRLSKLYPGETAEEIYKLVKARLDYAKLAWFRIIARLHTAFPTRGWAGRD